jgi:multidrug transporter EmrE-like cation transporter
MHYLILLIAAIAFIEIIAQCCVKHGHSTNNTNLFFIGAFCHILVGILLFYVYGHRKGVSYVNLLWSIISIIFAAVIGKFYFGDKINYPACSLVLLALVVIAYEETKG